MESIHCFVVVVVVVAMNVFAMNISVCTKRNGIELNVGAKSDSTTIPGPRGRPPLSEFVRHIDPAR